MLPKNLGEKIMTDYCVVNGQTSDELATNIKAKYAEGWECQGGVSVVLQTPRSLPLTKTYLLSQAMVKP